MKIRNALGRNYTTFKLGGEIHNLCEMNSIYGFENDIASLPRPFRVLGYGSNLLISDSGISEIVLKFTRDLSSFIFLKELTEDVELRSIFEFQTQTPGELVFATAGKGLMQLSRKVAVHGLSGLEFSAGIPGSIGGAIRMNAGAHGHSISEVVERVLIFRDNDFFWLENSDLGFSYRGCKLSPQDCVIGAVLKLSSSSREEISKNMKNCLEYRKRTQPLNLPSAGSTFRNPKGEKSAAQLIQSCGLESKAVGGVCLSSIHANWIVHPNGDGRASDVVDLIEIIKEAVHQRHGVVLEPEVVYWS